MKRSSPLSRALAAALIATLAAAQVFAQAAALTAGRRAVASPVVILPTGGFSFQAGPKPLVLGQSFLSPAWAAAPGLQAAQAPVVSGPALLVPISAAIQRTGITLFSPESRSERRTFDSSFLEGRLIFDGAKAAAGLDGSIPAVLAQPRGRAAADGWSHGAFPSSVDGAPISYKWREGAGPGPARVFSGGLALHESFEALFAASAQPAAGQLFLWTRGHRPTAWSAALSPLDADARDLARAIVLAARRSPSGKAELVLHSFGTLVFQKMVQLRGEPEVDEALRRLEGSRVIMLNATTHFKGSERLAGKEYERMADNTRLFVSWLDAMDSTARVWEQAARLNPFLGPQVAVLLASWRHQRRQALALASKDAAAMLAKDLAEPWDPAFEHIRRGFLASLEKESQDPDWQEALVRRSNDVFRFDFTRQDVRHIRQLGIQLTLVHAVKDQILNWKSAKALFDLLGIAAPEEAPAAGAVLTDRSGLFRAEIVDADHYYPLKRPDLLGGVLDRSGSSKSSAPSAPAGARR